MNRHADLVVSDAIVLNMLISLACWGLSDENIHVVDITDKSNIIPMRDNDGNDFYVR